MALALGLKLYLAFSDRADAWADRRLARRRDAGKEDPDRMSERIGQASLPRPDGRLLWFHCASVGESLSVLELIRRLGEDHPDLGVLVSTGTRTSAELLAKRLPADAIHQFVPVDTTRAVRNFLDHWQPDAAIWVESELWPRLMVETSDRGVPMMLLNARMSDRSFRRWRWLRSTSGNLLRRFNRILAQDQTTADYLEDLGADRGTISAIGTLKEGAQVLPFDDIAHEAFTKSTEGRTVWLAASTHPGEDEIVADAHRSLVGHTHNLLLLLVPRHPERGAVLAKELTEAGWSVALRSEGSLPGPDTQIYIADTLGELGLWFRIAPVSLIGGSLVDVGGHNPFEPAALGSVILHGPHVQNFADIYARLSEAKATREVRDAAELAKAVTDLMAPDAAAEMAHAAWEVSSRGAEVTDRAITEIVTMLKRAGAAS